VHAAAVVTAPAAPSVKASLKKATPVTSEPVKAAHVTSEPVKAAHVKAAHGGAVDLVFRDSTGDVYPSLSAYVTHVTKNRAWSPLKFFGREPKTVKAGDLMSRDFKGVTYTVTAVAQ